MVCFRRVVDTFFFFFESHLPFLCEYIDSGEIVWYNIVKFCEEVNSVKHKTFKSISLSALVLAILLIFSSCVEHHVHSFGEWSADNSSSCIVDGTEIRKCSCGETETRTAPAKNHDFDNGACKNCGARPSEGLEFKSNGDGTCTFVGRGTCTDAEIIFPTKSPAGDTLTKLMGGRFFGDEVLTAVYIPETVIDISVDFVAVCPTIACINVSEDNTVYSSVGGVLYNKDGTTLIKYPEAKNAVSFDIPATVTTIATGAFMGAENLTSISIPESVTTIEMSAFQSCSGLTAISIPAGVTTIASGTFASCISLKSISLPDTITAMENDVFSHCESLKSFTVPKGVTTIPESAFYSCKELTEVVLHDGVTTIGPKAFYLCTALKQITLPASVARIYERAFLSCTSLESIILPDGVKTIYTSTFQNCPALASVTIPSSVEKIEEYAFSECKALSSIVFKGTKSQWESVKTKGNWRSFVPATGVTCSDGTLEF